MALYRYQFEYDREKSAANLAKHGIDFQTAQLLWLDEGAIEVSSEFVAEDRMLRIGVLAERHWTVVFTMRDGRVRIISARRSRPIEVEKYEQEDDQR
jgi:uncharacterized DUF497 family protein